MKKQLEKTVTATLDVLDTKVVEVGKSFDTMVTPARESFAKRYPTLFSVVATLGVIMTFLGVEQLLLASELLVRYPIIILFFGIALLALTGTLYKKLGS